jgi:hypothetical protein
VAQPPLTYLRRNMDRSWSRAGWLSSNNILRHPNTAPRHLDGSERFPRSLQERARGRLAAKRCVQHDACATCSTATDHEEDDV